MVQYLVSGNQAMSTQVQDVKGVYTACWYLALVGLVLCQRLIHFALDMRVTERYLAPQA